jgi:hypothetical protein
MFTVKLCKGHTMRLIEAVEVNIYPCGRAAGGDDDPSKRTNKVREIAVETSTGQHLAFYVGYEPDTHLTGVTDWWDGAFIENAHGSTTENVRPY